MVRWLEKMPVRAMTCFKTIRHCQLTISSAAFAHKGIPVGVASIHIMSAEMANTCAWMGQCAFHREMWIIYGRVNATKTPGIHVIAIHRPSASHQTLTKLSIVDLKALFSV